MRAAEEQMSDGVPARRDAAVRRYGQLEERLTLLGGYAAEAEASSIASSLGLQDRVLAQPLATLSGGQRRRVELARILFADAQTLLLDEPTNHLDADSVAWLRDHLKAFRGGLVVISHDTALLDVVVNKVFHLDADTRHAGHRTTSAGRSTCSSGRPTRSGAGASTPTRPGKPHRCRPRRTRCGPRRPRPRRPRACSGALNGCSPGLPLSVAPQRVARLRFPDPAPCGRVPLTAADLSKSYGSLEVFTDVNMASTGDHGSWYSA